jgi:hypothetical protein
VDQARDQLELNAADTVSFTTSPSKNGALGLVRRVLPTPAGSEPVTDRNEAATGKPLS